MRGFDPTGIVATTVLVRLDITDTLFEPKLAMYMFPFAGSKTGSEGRGPTGMVAVTVFVKLSIRDTVPE